MEEGINRNFKIYFIKEYKWYFNKNNRKNKSDYILNINKIIKEKFNDDFYIMNRMQAFLLNYEIQKLLDKAINISNNKYDKIIYINDNITISSILNTVKFLNDCYDNITFEYILYDKNEEFESIKEKPNMSKLNIINELF